MPKSKVVNCHLIPRHDDYDHETIFEETPHDDGSVFVNMDGYLICPKDMFTDEEVAAAIRRYKGH